MNTDAPLLCASCGTALSPASSASMNAPGLCERCFLDQTHPGAAHTEAFAAAAFVEALAEALDLREHETGLHSRRVACHTQVLARQFTSDPSTLRQIYWGALLHDIGKIGVPDRILLKAGPLDAAEWAVMRRHPDDGFHIVSHLPDMALAAQVVLCHEERFDGSGYPQGLAGDAIPLGARLFAVIDTLDAITSDRPYRRGMAFDAAEAEICSMRGSQFDPIAVDAFLKAQAELRRMVAMKCTLPGAGPGGALPR